MSTESRPQPKPASDFWTSKTAEQLAAEQGVKPWTAADVEKLRELADELWPDEESVDEFLVWLRQLRREGGSIGKMP
jgi:hypothetical protein